MSKIAFLSNRDGNFEVYVMDADGTDLTNLTNNGAFDIDPAWSPDGKKIAFSSNRGGSDQEIVVMNADGSEAKRRTKNAAFDAQPAWSPDGTKIAFVSHRDGDSDIFVMKANGGSLPI